MPRQDFAGQRRFAILRIPFPEETAVPENEFLGGCLCGTVRYRIVGEPRRFYHCHCRRCRKATGTGHATNMFLQPARLEWMSGEASVRAYKVPEAARFTNTFCSECGGRLPRQNGDAVGVPAGSLDTEPSLAPQARIWVGSATRWSCHGDALPVFEEQMIQAT
jgi:hypothetical protein